MENIIIRRAEPKDYDRILELNEELVHFLSPLTREKLKSIISQSEIADVVEMEGSVEGFILALREGKEYSSVNYQWFDKHYEEFIYIDRLVISPSMQAKGIGKMVYKRVFEQGKNTNISYITAEIDIEPANPNSIIFHEKFGFKEVARQEINKGEKTVSLQVARID